VKQPPELSVSVIIPLELQRKCEMRWAARFLKPISTVPQGQSDGARPLTGPPYEEAAAGLRLSDGSYALLSRGVGYRD
jgi:hypothetical protein